tara:strand:- start:106864 stop:107208 length:345 start_codon:yes stop_codon:yes gene_type:complete
MNMIKSAIIALACSLSGMAFSHGSHTPVSPAEALNIAKYVAVKLSEEDRGMGFGKLDESWNSIPEDNINLDKTGPGFYIVTIENGREERTLYVLMSNTGEVYDANFSGKFEGVE